MSAISRGVVTAAPFAAAALAVLLVHAFGSPLLALLRASFAALLIASDDDVIAALTITYRLLTLIAVPCVDD